MNVNSINGFNTNKVAFRGVAANAAKKAEVILIREVSVGEPLTLVTTKVPKLEFKRRYPEDVIAANKGPLRTVIPSWDAFVEKFVSKKLGTPVVADAEKAAKTLEKA